MSSKIIILALFITSCGSYIPKAPDVIDTPVPETTLPDKDYDNDLNEFVDSFVEDAKFYGVDLPELSKLRALVWGDTKDKDHPTRVGVCYKSTYNRTGKLAHSKIVIHESYKRSDSLSLKGLVYHELGHCVLLRDHNEDLDNKVLMDPTMHGESYYKRCWEPLVEQLFLGGKINCNKI